LLLFAGAVLLLLLLLLLLLCVPFLGFFLFFLFFFFDAEMSNKRNASIKTPNA